MKRHGTQEIIIMAAFTLTEFTVPDQHWCCARAWLRPSPSSPVYVWGHDWSSALPCATAEQNTSQAAPHQAVLFGAGTVQHLNVLSGKF